MGSPYQLNVSKTVHVVRSNIGFVKQLRLIVNSMDSKLDVPTTDMLNLLCLSKDYMIDYSGCGPEGQIMNELIEAYRSCVRLKARVSITLSPRYDWRGAEAFARVVILDFTVRK